MVANVGPVGSGKPLRAAGVCNFSERQLLELLSYCRGNNLQKPAEGDGTHSALLQVFVGCYLCSMTKGPEVVSH